MKNKIEKVIIVEEDLKTSNICFDEKKYKKLQEKYLLALKNKKEIFIFEGHEFHTQYAKYMLEFLATKFWVVGA